ncbi:MAG: hypothetical protein ABI467_10375 [Kofleriaceae bacterium]
MKPRTILIVGWVVFLLYAYPGYLGPGAADQLIDARTGQFTDWNPVMMTEVWRLGWRFIDGPSVMLFLQSSLLLAGAYQLLRQLLVERTSAYLAVAILWFPAVIASTAVIAPEPMAASLLVAGTAALCATARAWKVVGLALFVAAGGMTTAALVAALPIVLAFLGLGVLRAVAAWATVVIVSLGLAYVLVDDRTERPALERAMHDIAGTLHFAPPLPSDQIATLLDGCPLAAPPSELQQRANRAYPKPGRYIAGASRLFEHVDAEHVNTVIAARDRLVRAQPRAYLRHRLHVWTSELGFTKHWHPLIESFVPARVDGAQLSYLSSHSLTQRVLLAPVRWLSRTALFRPHLYLAIAVILGIWAVVRRHRDAAVLLASGLAYELALMFTAGATPQWFDSEWLVVACLLGAVMVFFGELEPRHERIGEQAALGAADHDRVSHG